MVSVKRFRILEKVGLNLNITHFQNVFSKINYRKNRLNQSVSLSPSDIKNGLSYLGKETPKDTV